MAHLTWPTASYALTATNELGFLVLGRNGASYYNNFLDYARHCRQDPSSVRLTQKDEQWLRDNNIHEDQWWQVLYTRSVLGR